MLSHHALSLCCGVFILLRVGNGAEPMRSSLGWQGMTNPAGPERPLADATALSRLCRGSRCPRRPPRPLHVPLRAPACPLPDASPAAGAERVRPPALPSLCSLRDVTSAQAAPVIVTRDINANRSHRAEQQVWPLPLLQRARVRVHPGKAHGLDIAFGARGHQGG